jgi:hypothetical protein
MFPALTGTMALAEETCFEGEAPFIHVSVNV